MLTRRAGAGLALALGLAVGAPLAAATPAVAADPNTPVRIAIAMPITVPATSSGLLDAAALEAYTRPLGVLTAQLNAVYGRPVAIGVDPMIIASIRILGADAPESALDWLERLEDAPNQTFPLAYADLDLTLATQAGATVLPAPTSFPIDTPIEVEPTATPTAKPTPKPTDEPATDVPPAPGVDEILAWPWSRSDLAWPREGTVVASDLGVIAASGYETTIVSSTNLAREASALPITQVDGHGVLVSDAGVSEALRVAAAATDAIAWSAAMTDLWDALAAAARTQPGDQATVFATLPRALPMAGTSLADTIDALVLDARAMTIPLSSALAGDPDTASISDAPQPADRVAEAAALLDADAQVMRFATVATEPLIAAGEERLAMLALLSNAWESSQSGWPTAVDDQLKAARDLRGLVQVGETSRLNLLADRQTLPIPIVNGLDQPITVFVEVDPSSTILAVEDRSVELTIEPNSQQNALVPVQAVSNGTVRIQVTLTSLEGVTVGSRGSVEVVVNAGWETPIFLVFAGAVVALFVGGIIRNIVRRRRTAAAESASAESA